jgi:hypothetical protein
VVVNVVGFGQVIGGVQNIVASHPAATPVALEVNTNDKHPLGFVAVKEGGKVVPVYVPRIGDVIKFPFLITKLSPAAKLNVLNKTVTTLPALFGHTVVSTFV